MQSSQEWLPFHHGCVCIISWECTPFYHWSVCHYIIELADIVLWECLPFYHQCVHHYIMEVSAIILWKCPPFYNGSVCHYIIFCMMLLVSIITLSWPFDLDIEHFRLLHSQASIFCSVFYFIFDLFPFLSVSFFFVLSFSF